ncbi:hypothetical protein [Streptacidiphilus sp. EB129]
MDKSLLLRLEDMLLRKAETDGTIEIDDPTRTVNEPVRSPASR